MNNIENDRFPAKNNTTAPFKWKAFSMHPEKIINADIIPIFELILFMFLNLVLKIWFKNEIIIELLRN